MKKIGILLLLVLFSCGKADIVPVPDPQSPILFELSATHPEDTKAVKTGWENGDVVFVFFKQDAGFTPVVSPNYLKMNFSNSSWSTTEMGSLGLSEGDKGSMTAVYLPFGNSAGIAADSDGNYVFSSVYQSYYLTGQLRYEVKGNKVSGTLDMKVPANFVQFYVKDSSPADGAYKLGTDAVFPVGVIAVTPNAEITEEAGSPGWNMPGYVYNKGDVKGYLFSGKLNQSYTYGKNYYFAKTQWSEGNQVGRADYFVAAGKQLESHASILLPDNSNSDKWIPVGSGKTVNLGTTAGTWQTCNLGESDPDDAQQNYTFSNIQNQAGLPEKTDFNNLVALTHHSVSVYGSPGVVFMAASDGKGFIFLPTAAGNGKYWIKPTSTDNDNVLQVIIGSNDSSSLSFFTVNQNEQNLVRLKKQTN